MRIAGLILTVVLLAGCACIPQPINTEDLELGTDLAEILEIGDPYTKTEIREPGSVIVVLRYVGGTVLTFRNGALIKVEEKQ